MDIIAREGRKNWFFSIPTRRRAAAPACGCFWPVPLKLLRKLSLPNLTRPGGTTLLGGPNGGKQSCQGIGPIVTFNLQVIRHMVKL